MTDEKQAELLPCPFCGGEAILYDRAPCTFVQCSVCKTSSDDSSAVKRWNTRQALTAPQVDVEGLKEEQRRYFNAYHPDICNALYNHGDALIDCLAARGLIVGTAKEGMND